MKKEGFTLIEVLVVIAILAGLVAILFPNFMDARARARDAQRKSDLKSLQKALELYKNNQTISQYPQDANLPNPCSNWTVASLVYMAKVPGDPSGTCPINYKKYYYHVDPSSTGNLLEYNLFACLENTADSEGIDWPGITPDFLTLTGYSCVTGKYYRMTEP